MNKVATSLTPSRGAGVEGPSIDELIKTGSLHQRLAAARTAREKALAANGEQKEQFLSGLKPWERPEYVRGEPKKASRDQSASDRSKPKDSAPAPLVLDGRVAAEPEPAAAPVAAAVTAAVAPNRLRQVAGGAAFGIAVGIGLGYWFAGNTLPDATATIALTDEAPTALPGNRDAELARIALPATDAVPATPDAPRLSNVTSLSATLPAITGGSPIQRDTTLAPHFAEAAPQTMDIGLVSPRFVALPRSVERGDLTLPGSTPDLRFTGLAALPRRVSIAPVVTTLPADDATPPPLPPAPDAVAGPVSWQMPDTVKLPLSPSDTPLAKQDTALPVSRPAPSADLILILHAPVALPGSEVDTVAEKLSAGGFGSAASRPVDFTISRTNVRYFSPEDAEAAGAVAEALNAQLRDFTSFVPRPPVGTVEIWLAGQGAARPRPSRKPRPRRRRAARRPSRLWMP